MRIDGSHEADDLSELSLELDVYYGWCTLRLACSGESLDIKSHWLGDGLSDLAEAVRSLADGVPSVSVVWAREIGGGHFIDLIHDTKGGVSLCVHDRPGDGSTVEEVFSAERGQVKFRCHVPVADLVTSLATALRTVRVRSVDATGFMRDWGRTFPFAAYDALETLAVRRYGYKPVPTADISVDEPPDSARHGRARRR